MEVIAVFQIMVFFGAMAFLLYNMTGVFHWLSDTVGKPDTDIFRIEMAQLNDKTSIAYEASQVPVSDSGHRAFYDEEGNVTFIFSKRGRLVSTHNIHYGVLHSQARLNYANIRYERAKARHNQAIGRHEAFKELLGES